MDNVLDTLSRAHRLSLDGDLSEVSRLIDEAHAAIKAHPSRGVVDEAWGHVIQVREEIREKGVALAAACEQHKPAKNMGDLALLDVLPSVAECLIDWADRLESATTPAAIDSAPGYSKAIDATPAEVRGEVKPVEQAIGVLVDALASSKGWIRGYADAVLRDAIDRIESPDYATLARQLAEANRRVAEVEEAALDVIARWDCPKWKDAEPTAAVINRLRNALQKEPTP